MSCSKPTLESVQPLPDFLPPTQALETSGHVLAERKVRLPLNGDPVIVVDPAEVPQLEVTCQRGRLTAGTWADIVILDLEDSVVESGKAAARAAIAEFLAARSEEERARLWVRVNPLDGEWTAQDLAAIMPARPVPESMDSVNLSIRVEVVGPAGPTTSLPTGSTGPT